MDRLAVATASVLLILGYGLFDRFRPVSFGVALGRVVEGSQDKRDWLKDLLVLHEEGLRRLSFGDLQAGRIAASAAILRGDEAGYRIATRLLHTTLGVPEGLPGAGAYASPSDRVVAALGEAMVERLFAAHAAHGAGDLEAARRLYRQAAGAAFFRESELCSRLVQEGLSTLP